MRLAVERETWTLRQPFRISGAVFNSLDMVIAILTDASGLAGRGESVGVGYRNDTADQIVPRLQHVASMNLASLTRGQVQELLPAGGARNALDCAFWDLAAKQQQQPVWRLADLPRPRPLLTTFTVGVADPDTMAREARAYRGARAIKIKLLGDALDADRVKAVRDACPKAWLGVDANQGYTPERLKALLPELVRAGVELIEQPLPVGREAQMVGLRGSIALAADESAQSSLDLPNLVGRFDVVNIKLDKCGGLTHALRMAREARQLGLRTMVGNMIGTSWAMASAFIVGQLCEIVDLDGPLFLRSDRDPAVRYEDGYIHCPDEVWGAP